MTCSHSICAAVGDDAFNLSVFDVQAGHCGELVELRSAALGAFLEGERCEEWVRVSVALVEHVNPIASSTATPGHISCALFLSVNISVFMPSLCCSSTFFLNCSPFVRLVGHKQISALVEAGGESEFFFEVLEGVEAGKGHAAVQFQSPLLRGCRRRSVEPEQTEFISSR